MQQVYSFAQQTLPVGTITIPATAFGATVNEVVAVIARCTTATPTIWPDSNTTLTFNFDISYDGGNTWYFGAGDTRSGGIASNKRGEITQEQFSRDFPTPPTHFRGTIVVSGGPILTSGSVSYR